MDINFHWSVWVVFVVTILVILWDDGGKLIEPERDLMGAVRPSSLHYLLRACSMRPDVMWDIYQKMFSHRIPNELEQEGEARRIRVRQTPK